MDTIREQFLNINAFAGAGAYEQPNRSLFFRKALALRRYYETCDLFPYDGKPLYPSGALIKNAPVFPDYLKGLEINPEFFKGENAYLVDEFRNEFDRFRSHVNPTHTISGNMWTHSMPNYERILREGLNSYQGRVDKIENDDFREGLTHLISGIRAYLNRCIDYLKSVNADEKLVRALEKVPFNPATNIYEAVVSWNFIAYLDDFDNLGCIDSGLMPYYDGENIVPLLENLFDNINACSGYSGSIGITDNPLTEQCLIAVKGKRRPMLELFVSENTANAVWEKAFESIKTSNGQPAFYNKDQILGGLKERFPFILDDDLNKFCGGGCTETMLGGLSNVGSVDAGINLLHILEQTMYAYLPVAKDFDDFYQKFISEVLKIEEETTTQISLSQRDRAIFNPLPMRTLLVDDCIDNATDFNAGGTRYRWSIINFSGMINVIDSLFVIRDFVFRNKTYSATALLEKLRSNDDEFLQKARSYKPCFGVDNDEVNALCYDFSSRIYDGLKRFTPYLGGGFLPASIQFNTQVCAGKNIGATPDGRKNGDPSCDSLGAIFHKDANGPTALLNSVSSFALPKAVGIPIFNFNLNQSFDPQVLRALVKGFFANGGMQMQITCADIDTLKKAYDNPELFPNLVVRVGGYAEYFNRLDDETKKMIIARSIQSI